MILIFFIYSTDNMLVNGEKFSGSTSYVDNHTTLRTHGLPSSGPSNFQPYRPFTGFYSYFIDMVCALS